MATSFADGEKRPCSVHATSGDRDERFGRRAATTDWLRNANVRFRYDPSQDATCTASNAAVDFAVLPTTISGLAACGANKLLWTTSDGCGGQFGVLLVQYSAVSG